jgi:ABC-type phosphate/phosphonate transport system substrate-binding protein
MNLPLDLYRRLLLGGGLLAALVLVAAAGTHGQQSKISVLRIGTSGTFHASDKGVKEETALDTMKKFITDETGFNNEIIRQKSWRELAKKMADKQLEVGVFQGYEFAWAQAEDSQLTPLATAVNVYRYPIAYLVASRDAKASDFAGLQGQTLALPAGGEGFLRLYVDRQSEQNGKKLESFFSKVTAPSNMEDAVDDAIDGVVQAAAVDRAGLEAYKRRKPGRFKRLKEISHSQPFPPTVVAYYNTALDQATLERLQNGLVNAHKKETGQMLLNLFRLTSFETIPSDFGQVLTAARKAYPPPNNKEK